MNDVFGAEISFLKIIHKLKAQSLNSNVKQLIKLKRKANLTSFISMIK